MHNRQDAEIYEDEIDLRVIFSTIWKRKWLIAGITFITVLGAVLYSNLQPKIYEASMVIEPGIIDFDAYGKYTYLDTPENIKGRIESNVYLPRILKALHRNPDDMNFDFKVSIPKNANVLIVSSKYQAKKPVYGLQILHQLLLEIQRDYSREVSRKKDWYQKQMSMKMNEIYEIKIQLKDLDQQVAMKHSRVKEKREQIKLINSRLSICERRERDLLNDLNEVKENTRRISGLRDQMLKQSSANSESGIADLLYSTTIHQNMALFNELKNQFYQTKIDRENLKSEIKKLDGDINEIDLDIERLKLLQTEVFKSRIDAIEIEIGDLQSKINQIQNMKIISDPTVSRHPVNPRPVRNIVIALMGGVLLGIFIAFLSEYRSIERKTSAS